LETTGLSKHKHNITEIAAVKVNNNKIVNEFSTLINPCQHIPSFITRITGINDKMVAEAPKINQALPHFLKFLKDDVIIAHNATFDHGFISENAARHTNTSFLNSRVCTRKLATRLLPTLPSKRLECVCNHFNIKNQEAHRAMGDTIATAEVFSNFLNILNKAEIKTKEDILKFESMPVPKAKRLIYNNL
tara:strand:- start:3702 stop:4271 length:570 start_codon:yes stop_codon:yes gene_type:complete